ncbi:MAG: lipopolysaccharide biosynthesis protein [Sedimentisphaerales bacterium]|nr:lipopolysaccharide biosynthesis protein [Sedimentisphaerales bacterium]
MPQAKQLSDDSTHNLKGRTVRGGVMVIGSMLAQKIVGLVILAIMARLLTPEDYGLLGMVFAMTMFLQIFADMGLPLATVQKANLTQPQISTMFWINLLSGILLGVATAAAAPLIAFFFHKPVLISITVLCAINFPIVALGAQHSALLQRRMEFGRLAVSDIAGLIVGGTTGITMALRGYGVLALVGQQLAGSGAVTFCNWLLTGWIPGMPARKCGVQHMLKLGGYLTAFNFVNYFARNIDKILLGRFYGAVPLGLYTRGYALMMFPVGLISGPISRVIIPTLSKIQHDLPRMRAVYLHVLQIIGFISFPLMVWLMICGSDVIAVVYGQKWMAAASIFKILCVVGIWQGIYNATGQVFMAAGRTDRQFKVGLFMAIVLAVAFAIGIRWGAKGVAISYAAAFSVAILPYLAYTYATVGLRLWVVLCNLWQSFAAAVGMIPLLWFFQESVFSQWTPAARLCCSFCIAASSYLLLSIVINRAFLTRAYIQIVAFLYSSFEKRLSKESTI